jgi:hypothetical protein
MRLLHAGVDPVVIALWLGHERIETTNVYVHADITLKEPWLERSRSRSNPAATEHPTHFSPSWSPCDYADTASLTARVLAGPRPLYRHNSRVGLDPL